MTKVIDRILEILKSEGLDGILKLDTQEPKWVRDKLSNIQYSRDALQIIEYRTPPNDDGLAISYIAGCDGISKTGFKGAKERVVDIWIILWDI